MGTENNQGFGHCSSAIRIWDYDWREKTGGRASKEFSIQKSTFYRDNNLLFF